MRVSIAVAALLALVACGNPVPGEPADRDTARTSDAPADKKNEAGEAVTPPFDVRGELEGLLLVWFDAEGPHVAQRRSDIPEARRAQVRIDSLRIVPDKKLDPEHVYVADLRQANANGSYAVRKHSRAFFDQLVDDARRAQETARAAAGGDVTIYMASWCGACRSAAKYLRSKGVPFTEKDVEKDAAANAEMLRKAQAAGKRPNGVPVIDFRGEILLGFDRDAIDRLIALGQPI